MGSNRGSKEGDKHPYMRLSFWLNPENQFWEKESMAEHHRQRYRDWLYNWANGIKNIATLEDNLK